MKKLNFYSLIICLTAITFFVSTEKGNAQTVMFESVNIKAHFISHQNGRGKIRQNLPLVADGQFKLVNGLSGQGKSLQSVNFPNHYLRHKDGKIFLEPFQNNNLYKQDASWFISNGLSNSSAKSLKSVNFPSNYIRHRDGLLFLENPGNNSLAKQDATFFQRSVTNALVDVFEGADPELTNFDGQWRIYVTNQGGKVRCMRPYNNNNLRGSWYATTAWTLPSWFKHGWAPAVVKVNGQHRMYLSGRDTRIPNQANDNNAKGVFLLTSNNPNSGYQFVEQVLFDNDGGCTDVIDATVDGGKIYYGGSFGGGCFVANLTNNGKDANNWKKVTELNTASEFSEGAFVGNIPNVGKVMLYARGKWFNDTYGTNWAKWENNKWVPKGRVKFPGADQYLFRLGHASTKNGWIAVNSNRAPTNSKPRRIAIGQIKLVNGSLQGNKSNTGTKNDGEEVLEVVFEEFSDIDVVADFGTVEVGELKIFPNPTREILYIAFNVPNVLEDANAEVYDLTGRLVLTKKIDRIEGGSQSIELNVGELTPGNYFVKLSSNGKSLGDSKQILIN